LPSGRASGRLRVRRRERTYTAKIVSLGALALAAHPWPWWSGSVWPWPLLWLLFVVLFWGGLIALLVWAVRSSTAPRRRPDTAMEVLRRRLAAGEITSEEYEHIRQLLSD
jgi:putative membrane protein